MNYNLNTKLYMIITTIIYIHLINCMIILYINHIANYTIKYNYIYILYMYIIYKVIVIIAIIKMMFPNHNYNILSYNYSHNSQIRYQLTNTFLSVYNLILFYHIRDYNI